MNLENKENNNPIEKESSFMLPENAFEDDFNIATYFYKAPPGMDVYEKAKNFAVGQSVGTWVDIPNLTPEIRYKYGGKVVSIYDIPPYELTSDLSDDFSYHIIQIAFPYENYIPQFPLLLTTLLGNDVSTSSQLKLIDLKFSRKFLNHFNGPKFGIDEIYKYLKIKEKRPVILNMIKPCLGITPDEGAEIFRQVALGGVDIIKDDELFAETSYSPIEERVKIYTKIAGEVYNETGHETIYCVNITDRFDKMVVHAQKAIDAGAKMLMVNFVATGLGALQALSENTKINVPLLAHYATAGSITESPMTGISTPILLGKLSRLAGADICMFSSPYSEYPFIKRRYMQIADLQRLNFAKIKSTMPAIGGGVHPNSAEIIVNDLGIEIVLAVGGAILGHPKGIIEGSRSMMQAAEALARGVRLSEIAENIGFESLKVAIEIWR